MYRKDVNERSPLRVFERSIHGGLGRGNVGLVMSRAGVGKTAVLVGLALDDLMRDRKVLHVNTENPAEKVRAFYDEVFHDLAEGAGLEDKETVHRQVERNRMIHTFLHGSFSMEKLRDALGYAKMHMGFEPFAIVLDGFPQWEGDDAGAIESQLKELKTLAVDTNTELWLSARSHREDELEQSGVPTRLNPYLEYLSVVVRLDPESNHVKLHLCKDHENPDVANLHIELDPKTLLLKWQ